MLNANISNYLQYTVEFEFNSCNIYVNLFFNNLRVNFFFLLKILVVENNREIKLQFLRFLNIDIYFILNLNLNDLNLI